MRALKAENAPLFLLETSYDQPESGLVIRVALALTMFLTVTGVAFIAMTSVGIGLLELLTRSAGLGFGLMVFAPTLVFFFIVSVIVGLWTSQRVYFRPGRWSLGHTIGWILLLALAAVAGTAGLLSLALARDDCPPLASGLYGPWPDINKAFAKRLNSRFAVGSSESVLMDELLAEHFNVDQASHKATFDGDGFPCRNTWLVYWRAESQDLVAVTGTHAMPPACL